MNQRHQLLIVSRDDAQGDRRPHLAAVAVAAVAPGAPAFEGFTSRVDVLTDERSGEWK